MKLDRCRQMTIDDRCCGKQMPCPDHPLRDIPRCTTPGCKTYALVGRDRCYRHREDWQRAETGAARLEW